MNDNYNDFEGGYTNDQSTAYTPPGGYGLYGEPRWDDFSLDDEKKAKKRFSRFFLATVAYLLLSTVLVNASFIAVALIKGVEFADEFFANPYVNMACQVLFMYVISLPIFYLIIRGMRSVIRRRDKISVKEFFALFLVGEACMLGGSMISGYITDLINIMFGIEVTDNVSALIEATPLWLVFVVAVVIGPIVEELMFRKLLMDKLGMYGDRLAIVVSAVAFGIFHGDINQLIYATLLGFVLAYLYSRTGNVWLPILLHSIINFFGSIIPMLLMEPMERYLELADQMLETEEIVIGNEAEFLRLTVLVGGYSLFVYAMLFAGLFIFFKYRKRIFVSDRCEILIPKKRRFNVAVLNVGAIVFLVISIGTMLLKIIEPILATGGAA